MTEIVLLPHYEICPEGAVIEAEQGETVCEALLRNDIEIEHACEMSCACTTCHVVVREGFDSLGEADELEEDYLDKAWGLEPNPGCPVRHRWVRLIWWSKSRATPSTTPRNGTEYGPSGWHCCNDTAG